MDTLVLKPDQLNIAAEILKLGGLVAMPTETVYGLGADALNELAVANIFKAKGRPSDNPLIVHISEFSEIYDLVSEVPEIAKKLLVSRNLDVDVAENGVLAIDIVKNAKPNYYDAILMDIRMPLMDGLTATKTIRNLPTKWTEKVPIIAMTANAFEEDIQKTKEAGMNAHLSKPIEPNLLFSTLANFIL